MFLHNENEDRPLNEEVSKLTSVVVYLGAESFTIYPSSLFVFECVCFNLLCCCVTVCEQVGLVFVISSNNTQSNHSLRQPHS